MDLSDKTTECFDAINFTELNDRWIDEVIDNEFTEAGENDMTLSILFVGDALSALDELATICSTWCEKLADDESTVNDPSDISFQEENMWAILDKMDISVKHILGLIYLLCSRAKEKTSSQEERFLGLASARFYFNCLRIPGSAAYSVYHPNLFQLCVDCLPAPDFASEKDSAVLKEFQKMSLTYISTLLSLISILKYFHLGNDSSTVEHTIKKLTELVSCEIQNHINFDINILDLREKEMARRFKPSHIVSMLAYQSYLSLLDTDLNGDKDKNYLIILSYLNRHILCYKAKKSQSISQKYLLVKDNAVSFICHNLKTKAFASEVTLTSLKRLCLAVSDKAEFRSTVSAAVVNILFCLKAEHIAEMIQWILLLIDSADTKDRVFALDVLGYLLNNTQQVDCSNLPEYLQVYLTRAPIIFAILTRCDDTSSAVRTKALTVVSQNIENILNFLDTTKDQDIFEAEMEEEIYEKDFDVNGNHRFFWYKLKSFRERLNEIESILHRRIEDVNVTARKAALLALENLMVFDVTYLSEENFKCFDYTAKDGNIIVRKQLIQSVSAILDSYLANIKAQESWLKCVLPFVQDPESTVQVKALAVMEEKFLQKIFSSDQNERKCSFSLLQILTSGDFLFHQKYLQKAFYMWKSENKLKSQILSHLEKDIETEWEGCVWFYISNFAGYCSLPSKLSHLCVEKFMNYHNKNQYPKHMALILKVLKHIFQKLSPDQLEVIQVMMSDSLKSLTVPVSLISMYVETMYKMHTHIEKESEFFEFSTRLFQHCEEFLSGVNSDVFNDQPPSMELIVKCFCIIKELCQLRPSYITPNIISLLKSFSACIDPSKSLKKILTPSVRAHAFAALGKICLQDELLAKDLLHIFAKELLTSKDDVIRNNVVIILIDMCKRYTSFADKYVPLISQCFKDRLYLIRYQTIILIVNLLQEGYIKWRGPLFFCLLSTLTDTRETIQELGRYSLSQLLRDKKTNLFSEHFVDSIFVFNNFAPPDNETVAQTVRELERFALKGEMRREERMLIYKFLLNSMEIKDRAYLIKSVCDIIMNIADAVYPLNEATETIVRDCFAIFTCNEIRAFTIDQVHDDIDEAEEKDILGTELHARKIVIIDPVIPVMISLKNCIMCCENALLQDLIVFLKELLHDFKDGIREILSGDKLLLRQVELEMKNDVERERVEKKSDKAVVNTEKQTDAVATSDITVQDIQSLINTSQYLITGKVQNNIEEPASVSPAASNKSTRKTSSMTKSLSKPGSNSSSSSPLTYNIVASTPSEAKDLHRFASTPRVVLTPIRIPKSSTVLNLSAIEKANGPRTIEESDEEML